jgi:hypothetical protein
MTDGYDPMDFPETISEELDPFHEEEQMYDPGDHVERSNNEDRRNLERFIGAAFVLSIPVIFIVGVSIKLYCMIFGGNQ